MATSVSLPHLFAGPAVEYPLPRLESRFASVTHMTKHDIPKVKEVLEIWMRYVKEIMGKHPSPQAIDPKTETSDLAISTNYLGVYMALKGSVEAIEKDPCAEKMVLLAKDQEGQIQSALSYDTKNPEFFSILELLSAPWNLRFSTPCMNIFHPLRGGGVMLIDALCKIALREKVDEVSVVSQDIARPFYTKIGMRESCYPFFTFEVENKEHQAKIRSAMERAFGRDFHYSLLTET